MSIVIANGCTPPIKCHSMSLAAILPELTAEPRWGRAFPVTHLEEAGASAYDTCSPDAGTPPFLLLARRALRSLPHLPPFRLPIPTLHRSPDQPPHPPHNTSP